MLLREEIEQSNDRVWESMRAFVAAHSDHLPVRKVAAVGNAPLAPSEDRAAEIDSCDLVFRVNSLVLDELGEPACMGTKTDVVLLSRSTNVTPWVFQDYRQRAYLLLQAGFTASHQVRDTTECWPADLGAWPLPNGAVVKRLGDILAPDRAPGSLIPTGGTISMLLAHEFFPEAEMVATGYSFLRDRQQSEWAHHFGGKTSVNKGHRLELEGALLESWILDGSIRFLE